MRDQRRAAAALFSEHTGASKPLRCPAFTMTSLPAALAFTAPISPVGRGPQRLTGSARLSARPDSGVLRTGQSPLGAGSQPPAAAGLAKTGPPQYSPSRLEPELHPIDLPE